MKEDNLHRQSIAHSHKVKDDPSTHNAADTTPSLADIENLSNKTCNTRMGIRNSFEVDPELIQKCIFGDKIAFHTLYQSYVNHVYTTVNHFTQDKQEAEEITQEIFIQLWRKIHMFSGGDTFSTWFHRMAINTALGLIRKRKPWWRRLIPEALTKNTIPSIKQSSEQRQEMEDDAQVDTQEAIPVQLNQLLNRLPEQARLVFVLNAIEGYSHEEVSIKLDIAIESSKSLYLKVSNLLNGWTANE